MTPVRPPRLFLMKKPPLSNSTQLAGTSDPEPSTKMAALSASRRLLTNADLAEVVALDEPVGLEDLHRRKNTKAG